MRIYFLLLFLFLSFHIQSQPVLKESIWLARQVSPLDITPLKEDKDKEIKTISIKKSEPNNSYSGTIEYKSNNKLVTDACILKISGSNITINVPNKQSWSGEIFSVQSSRMEFSLGSLQYNFILLPVRNQSQPRAKPEPTFLPEQFYGSWLETNRKDTNNNKIRIGAKDTIYIRIKDKDNAILKIGSGAGAQEGNITITGDNDFTICGNTYIAKLVTAEQMVLFDELEFRNYYFSKTTESFSWEKKQADKPNVENPVMPAAKGIPDLSPNALLKKWAVFNVKSKEKITEDMTILLIDKKITETSFSGMVTIRNFKAKTEKNQPCKLNINGKNISITAEGFIREGLVLQSDGDTLKFANDNGDMYSLKKITNLAPTDRDTNKVVIDLRPEKLLFQWVVKKVDSGIGLVKPETAILKELHFIKQTDSLQYSGKVIFNLKGKTYNQVCTIDLISSLKTRSWITITTNGTSWKSELFQSNGKEIIFGRKPGEIRYTLNKK